MARFTTDFLTWLKGLFHTKTEVNTLLDKKINTVDVQGKITSFTNKDRINIERLINYMENGSGSNYYTLTLRATSSHAFSETVNNAATTANLGVTNGDVASADNKNSACFVIDLRKNGAIQKSSLPTIALKSIDGTKILEFEPNTFSFNTASGYKYGLARNFFGSTPGIHYVYAEATISGSVYKSNILGVFVKDNNNLLDYNVWSGTDYQDNIGTIAGHKTLVTSSNDYSTNGEKSFKITFTGNSFEYINFQTITGIVNKTYTGHIKVLNIGGPCTFRLINRDTNQHVDVTIPSSNNSQVLTNNIKLNDNGLLLLQINSTQNTVIYVDDMVLTSS